MLPDVHGTSVRSANAGISMSISIGLAFWCSCLFRNLVDFLAADSFFEGLFLFLALLQSCNLLETLNKYVQIAYYNLTYTQLTNLKPEH